VFVEREVRDQALQPPVLVLQRPQLPELTDAECAYFFFQM
jgi:hypothetical protein